ncbi:MAG: hypothetical protein PHT94_03595 [Candidatus Nanoarchaeia archaeon]|nr:hypothetical protein [Candidatus Nanoarchaeia archaeon]
MFKQIEEQARKELIKLYEDYINDKNTLNLEKRALWCEQKYGAVQILSTEVAHAGSKSTDIALKELDINEAKRILKTLK